MLSLAVCFASPAFAADPTGVWYGKLTVSPKVERSLTLRLKEGSHGLEATLDDPGQGIAGEPLADVSFKDGELAFTVAPSRGTFMDEWDRSIQGWKGVLTLAGRQYPLEFTIHWTTPSDEDIRALLAQRTEVRYRGAAMVVGVIDASGVRVVGSGVRSAKDPRPPEGDTVFEIGSITKAFTGLLLADMIDKGEVGLNDPVAKYLPPDVIVPSHGGKQITLADLATNTSGLPDNPGDVIAVKSNDPSAGFQASSAQTYALLKQIQLTRDPGVAPSHSNLGVGLLGIALARRAGLSYEALVEQRITGPLGMTSTAVSPTPSMQARKLAGHGLYLAPAPDFQMGDLAGAGQLSSTADDMLKFLGAELGFVNSPLKAAMTTQITAVRRPASPLLDMSLEMILLRNGIVMTNGGTFGFQSFMGFDPKRRVGVVVLANVGQGSGPRVTDDIGAHILAGSPVATLPAVIARTAIALQATSLDRYVGRYEFGPQLFMTITLDGDHLRAQVNGDVAYEIFPQSPTAFFYKATDAQLSFTVGPDGQATGLAFSRNGATAPAKRVPP